MNTKDTSTDELRNAIANHRFKTMHEQALPTSNVAPVIIAIYDGRNQLRDSIRKKAGI